MRDTIAQSLRHDSQKVLSKARAAVGERREGDFRIAADNTRVETGRLAVTGQGLFLPVRASGAARIGFRQR